MFCLFCKYLCDFKSSVNISVFEVYNGQRKNGTKENRESRSEACKFLEAKEGFDEKGEGALYSLRRGDRAHRFFCIREPLRILQYQFDIQDFGRLRQKMESINHILRHMDGEDLQELTIKELQGLEKMLELGLHRIRSKKGNQIEEENARLHLKVQQLNERSTLENSTRVEFLLIEPSETRDHPQSSGSIHNSFTSMSQHKTSTIQHNEASDTFLQLRLSI